MCPDFIFLPWGVDINHEALFGNTAAGLHYSRVLCDGGSTKTVISKQQRCPSLSAR